MRRLCRLAQARNVPSATVDSTVPVFLDPPSTIVPYARFLDARGRRDERLTGARTPDAVEPESSVLPAPTGAAVEKAAALGVLPAVVSDPGR